MFRYTLIIMAIATAVSAAAIPMPKIAKTYPSSRRVWQYALNTAKLISTAFSISSVLMSIDTRLRRVKKPNTPMKKSTADSIRK